MRFELHCHSIYSKGKKIPCEGTALPKDIVIEAKRKGLEGIALTDHNTVRGLMQARKEARRQGIIFIPGIEISTLSGHVIALGINSDIKQNLTLDETLDRIREQGGISIAPHPFDIKGDGIKNKINRVDAVEVFNALNVDKLSNFATELKTRKMEKPVIAGSDAHTLEMIGYAINIIDACDIDSVLKKIKKGRVELKKSYVPLKSIENWSRERLRRSYKDVMDYVNENYRFPKKWLAKILLKKFINSQNMLIWDILANISLNLSRIYGLFKILSY